MRYWHLVVIPAFLLAACEDGPEQVYTPNEGDPTAQNGYGADAPKFVQPGTKTYETEGGGSDAAGRGKFCDTVVQDALIEQMVVDPIIPDVSLGKIPLWAADGKPLLADDLIGLPEDGKFCDGTYTYSDGFIWGTEWDIVVFFDVETRLVTDAVAYGNYQGALSGDYTREFPPTGEAAPEKVDIEVRQRIKIGERDLTAYEDFTDPHNLAIIYRMLQENFFDPPGTPPLPDNFDCIGQRLCALFYDDPTHPDLSQSVQISFQTSGVILNINKTGYVDWIWLQPVRVAPFEEGAAVTFDFTSSGSLDFALTNPASGCQLRLDDTLNWQNFLDSCTDPTTRDRTINRGNYNTYTMRDAVQVEFNSVDLIFKRDFTPDPITGVRPPVFPDAGRPIPQDELFGITFTRTLNAAVPQFVPQALCQDYATRVETMLADSVSGGSCTNSGDCPASGGWTCKSNRCDNGHPFFAYAVKDADKVTTELQYEYPAAAQTIDKIVDTTRGRNWVESVAADIRQTYDGLNAAQQAQVVGLDVKHPTTFIHPFTDAVLSAFTLGASDTAPFHQVYSSDDRRWSIAQASFKQGNVPYRAMVQYSVNYGAVTAISIDRGTTPIDVALNTNDPNDGTWPYYQIHYAATDGAIPFGLGGTGVHVHRTNFDRQLNMLEVDLQVPSGGLGKAYISLTVPGFPYEDETGYTRQIQGERFEFVPADKVYLYGNETMVVAYVTPDGTIGKVTQHSFKGKLKLCRGPEAEDAFDLCAQYGTGASCTGSGDPCIWNSGCFPLCGSNTTEAACSANSCFWFSGACTATLDLELSYGDNVRHEIDDWVGVIDGWKPGAGLDFFRRCDLVYNYSANGNILDSVASLQNRASLVTVDERAISASLWH